MKDKLIELQELLLSILIDVKTFCEKYDIKFCMAYGSAIGAVRHNGFIPWDDDLDIMMPIDQFDKFVDLWEKYGDSQKYYLQKIDENSKINHMKVILLDVPNGIVNNDEEGVFLDIFPMYKVKKNKIKTMYIWNMFRLLYTRGYVSEKNGGFVKFACYILLKFVPKCLQQKILKKANNKIRSFENYPMDDCEYISFATFDDMKYHYDYDIFDGFFYADFNGIKVPLSIHNDEMLKLCYGDYMQLPPENERVCSHHDCM